jgi:DNA-binding NarL/FixJ family response regulator
MPFLEHLLMHLHEAPPLPGGNTAEMAAAVMTPTRVLLIDDHRMVTDAIAARLSGAPDLWVAGRCGTADPNLAGTIRGARPDIITVETEPLGGAAGAWLAKLMAICPQARIVVLSSDHDTAHAVAAARSGAAAWVSKEQGATDLETVLRGVARGESWFPPGMLGEVLRELRADVGRAQQEDVVAGLLSKREQEVLVAMMNGKHAGQIAGELTIATDTVRTHVRNIFAKLDVHTRLEAVKVARDLGLGTRAMAA